MTQRTTDVYGTCQIECRSCWYCAMIRKTRILKSWPGVIHRSRGKICQFIAMVDLSDVIIIHLTTPTVVAYHGRANDLARTCCIIYGIPSNKQALIHLEFTPSFAPLPPRSMHSSLSEYALVSSRARPWSCRAWLAFLPLGYAHVASRPWPCGSAEWRVRGNRCRLVGSMTYMLD